MHGCIGPGQRIFLHQMDVGSCESAVQQRKAYQADQQVDCREVGGNAFPDGKQTLHDPGLPAHFRQDPSARVTYVRQDDHPGHPLYPAGLFDVPAQSP